MCRLLVNLIHFLDCLCSKLCILMHRFVETFWIFMKFQFEKKKRIILGGGDSADLEVFLTD